MRPEGGLTAPAGCGPPPRRADSGDAARIGDVVERVGVEHDEVGALARRPRAGVGDAQELGRVARL
jgi:hypothetical protein